MSERRLTPKWLRLDGFDGFVSLGDVRFRRATLSPLPGVYVVYRETLDQIEFLDKSIGGWFKG